VIQWQHGTYEILANNSISLTPISVDGRQLVSAPCVATTSTYTRYIQPELLKVSLCSGNHLIGTYLTKTQSYSVAIDPYHQVYRLDLYEFDGTPMNPMYLAYRPPEMLPTVTMNPTASSTGQATVTGAKMKREQKDESLIAEARIPFNYKHIKRQEPVDLDQWWYIAAGMTVLGGIGYFCV
jgi:hypothetical protein